MFHVDYIIIILYTTYTQSALNGGWCRYIYLQEQTVVCDHYRYIYAQNDRLTQHVPSKLRLAIYKYINCSGCCCRVNSAIQYSLFVHIVSPPSIHPLIDSK